MVTMTRTKVPAASYTPHVRPLLVCHSNAAAVMLQHLVSSEDSRSRSYAMLKVSCAQWRSNPVQVVSCWVLVTGFSSWFRDDKGWFRRVDQVGPSIIIQSHSFWFNQNRGVSVSRLSNWFKKFVVLKQQRTRSNQNRGQMKGTWAKINERARVNQ